MDEYKNKRKALKSAKRIAMKRDFKSSDERKSVRESFNREFRALKRSEKNKVKQKMWISLSLWG